MLARLRTGVWLLLVAVLALLLLLGFRAPRPGVLIYAPPKPDLLNVSLLDSILWRARRLFFAAQPVTIRTELFRLDREPDLRSLEEFPSRFYTATNGWQAWILPARKMPAFLERNAKTSAPTMVSADGIPSLAFMGETIVLNGVTNDVGLSVRCSSRIRRGFKDLKLLIDWTEIDSATNTVAGTAPARIQTNIALSAQLRVPAGSTALLMTEPNAKGERSAIWLSAQ